MTDTWEALMVVAAGLFTGGAATFSWSRVPIWRTMPLTSFRDDFSETLRRTDKVQPALLILAIVASVAYAVNRDGPARLVASAGAVGLVITLVTSIAVLVPLQKRIVEDVAAEEATVDVMRARWYRGQLGRSVMSTLSFVAVSVAATI